MAEKNSSDPINYARHCEEAQAYDYADEAISNEGIASSVASLLPRNDDGEWTALALSKIEGFAMTKRGPGSHKKVACSLLQMDILLVGLP